MISSTRLTNWCEGFIRLDFFQGLSHLPRPIPRPTNVPSLPLGKIIPVLGTLLDQELISNPFSIPIDFWGPGLGDDVDVGRNVCEWALSVPCESERESGIVSNGPLQTDPFIWQTKWNLFFLEQWWHVYFQRKLLSFCIYLCLVLTTSRVRLHWCESGSESYIASRWIHRESNSLFSLSNGIDQRKNRFRIRFPYSVNEPLNVSSASAVRSASVTNIDGVTVECVPDENMNEHIII